MKNSMLILALVAVSLASTAAAFADGTPPPLISGPAPVTQISSATPSAPGLTIPSADSLKPPKYQVMIYGGCAIALTWRPSGNLRVLSATPYGWCHGRHLSQTMAWSFSPLKKSNFVYDLYGGGFHVFTILQKLQARVVYSTVSGRRLVCRFKIAASHGTHICR